MSERQAGRSLPSLRVALVAMLTLSYPLSAHLAATSRRPALIAASVGLLVVLISLPGLRSRRPRDWILPALSTAALVFAIRTGHALAMLFLPPVLITGFVSWIFGRTLVNGRTPLIEQVIVAVHGNRDSITSAILDYARKLTLLWSAVLATLSATNLVLAAFATPGGLMESFGVEAPIKVPVEVWSLFANVINYLVLGAMFLVEYWYRRGRFPQQPYSGFVDFASRLASVRSIFSQAHSEPGAAGSRPLADRSSSD